MRSMLVRIFLAFWLIIAITIGIAAISGYTYAERLRATLENFEVSDTMLEASESLNRGGRSGLETWLRELPENSPMAVYVLDRRGRDLLGRRLPNRIAMAMRRFGGRPERMRPPRRDAGNLRPARPLTQLVGPDNHVYTFFVVPKRGGPAQWISERTGLYFLILAILVSAVVSYLLARAVSNPVSRFREATVAIAAGNLDTRVAESVGSRRDEIGQLARDFDRMTDELQQAWQQQTELTRNVSHELRSPLARLRVALELARREAGDLPEFTRIDTETERLDELIGQILSYSRLESRADDGPALFQLDDLLHTVVDDVRYECRSSGIEGVTIDLNMDNSPVVNGFAGALGSAVENVLRNAVRHSPSGSSVSVSLQQEAGQAVIEIRDKGSGVAEAELGKLFDPFFRSRTALDDRAMQGSGLGLAIAQRAVQKNLGVISASNVVGGGLSVLISLPLADAKGSAS